MNPIVVKRLSLVTGISSLNGLETCNGLRFSRLGLVMCVQSDLAVEVLGHLILNI